MNGSTTRERLKRSLDRLSGEHGMTLIEILTSMVIFLVVSTGIAGTMIIGLRSTAEAQLATMGKAIAQEQVEEMKARPFYVPYTDELDDGTTADIDMLDVYYPNTDTGSYVDDRGWEGWYASSAGDAYYTMVSPPDDRGMVTTVETRFIDSSGNVVVPAASYSADDIGYDYPPSYLVEITVTTGWPARDGEDSFQLTSRISGTDQTLEDVDVPGDPDDSSDDESDDESDDDECDMESFDGESDDESDDSADDASDDDVSDNGSDVEDEDSEDYDSEDTSDDSDSDDGSADEEVCDEESNDGESDDNSDQDSDDDASSDYESQD